MATVFNDDKMTIFRIFQFSGPTVLPFEFIGSTNAEHRHINLPPLLEMRPSFLAIEQTDFFMKWLPSRPGLYHLSQRLSHSLTMATTAGHQLLNPFRLHLIDTFRF